MTLKVGDTLQGGKYRIIRTLGQGGFGITYEAEQVALHRRVAIKEFFMKEYCDRDSTTSNVTLGTSEGSKELVERFRTKFVREAQLIAGFDNPHIIRIHDIFEENGTAYYVMAFLDGGSLADLVKKKGPLPENEAVKFILQISDALDYIHKQNVLHLDVKPSNVLLNSAGDAVLIDFGISKHYDAEGGQTSTTPTGISKGYAPLEQSRDGDVSKFNPTTDIYALGATLFHMVTGNTPPEASLVYEDGLDRPKKISNRIWTAVEAAMQPRRKDRPQRIAEFLDLLGNTNEKIEAEPKNVLDEVNEETVLAGVDQKVSDVNLPKITASILTPAAKERPKPKPAFSKDSISNAIPPNPSHRGLWIALTLGTAALGLALFYFLRSDGADGAAFQAADTFNRHECVDLGLSVKWATCNVGASSSKEYGDYFAWGETSTKNDYSEINYIFRVQGDWITVDSYNDVTFSRYNTSGENGEIDNRTRLDPLDDVASANWGGTWRTPTQEEWEELSTKCKWTWTSQGETKGYNVTGPNGNSIFLPAAGSRYRTTVFKAGTNGNYWSSSLNTLHPVIASSVYFDSDSLKVSGDHRFTGLSVRPVSD